MSHTAISKTAKGNEKTVTATSSVKSGQDLVKLAMQIKN
jgi:hypothetical protein